MLPFLSFLFHSISPHNVLVLLQQCHQLDKGDNNVWHEFGGFLKSIYCDQVSHMSLGQLQICGTRSGTWFSGSLQPVWKSKTKQNKNSGQLEPVRSFCASLTQARQQLLLPAGVRQRVRHGDPQRSATVQQPILDCETLLVMMFVSCVYARSQNWIGAHFSLSPSAAEKHDPQWVICNIFIIVIVMKTFTITKDHHCQGVWIVIHV